MRLEDVILFIKPNYRILNGISFTVYNGDKIFVEVLQKNVRDWLFNIICGMHAPDSGKVYLGQADVYALADRAKTFLRLTKVGIIWDELVLFDDMSVLENLRIVQTLTGAKNTQAVYEAAQMAGITNIINTKPQDITPYQRCLVKIARACVSNPQVYIVNGFGEDISADEYVTLINMVTTLKENNTVVVMDAQHHEQINTNRRFALIDNKIYEVQSI